MVRKVKQQLKRLYYRSIGLMPDLRIPVTTVNPGDQAWYFGDGTLSTGDVVYSLGLATNIDFDLKVIENYGVEVYGFDPTPESVRWISRVHLPKGFHHFPIAVAGHDGELSFSLPDESTNCARAVVFPEDRCCSPPPEKESTLTVPCKKISTLMKDEDHNRVDLLKMDIEGSEYEVIDDILNNQLDIPQIIVEFHHRFPENGMQKTLECVKKLRTAGYQLFHVSPWCEEYAFIKQR